MYTLGVNPTEVLDPVAGVTDDPDVPGSGLYLKPGTRAVNQDGNEYILLVAGGAIASEGFVGFWDEDFEFTLISSANDVGGTPVAVNRGLPTVAGQMFWAQTYGMGQVRAAAAAAADVTLATSATPGEVDDVVALFFPIEGLTFMEAATGQGPFNARISYPHTSGVVGA